MKKKPLIYSCSGCSSAAQLANFVAVKVDRSEQAEMSCIAGVGGDVKSLVAVAKSGRPIVVIDGCVLQCAANCLKRHDVKPDKHLVLSNYKVAKRYHQEFDADQAEEIYQEALEHIQSLKKTDVGHMK